MSKESSFKLRKENKYLQELLDRQNKRLLLFSEYITNPKLDEAKKVVVEVLASTIINNQNKPNHNTVIFYTSTEVAETIDKLLCGDVINPTAARRYPPTEKIVFNALNLESRSTDSVDAYKINKF